MMSCAVCTRDVCAVLCCQVNCLLSSAFVLASCLTCTLDNENYYSHYNGYGDQLRVINTSCTDEQQQSIATLIHSTDDDDDDSWKLIKLIHIA